MTEKNEDANETIARIWAEALGPSDEALDKAAEREESLDDWLKQETDDTKSEYYDCWRKTPEMEAHMSRAIPKSFDIVDLPRDRWPDISRWAWDVFMRHIMDFDGEKYAKWVIGDLRRMVNYADRRSWVWDHNGAGDFVRISSHEGNDRLIVVFDHESERSHEDGYAPGMDFLSGMDLDAIYASDTSPVGDGVAAMTEVYRYKIPHSLFETMQEIVGDDSEALQKYMESHAKDMRIITSPEVLAEKNSFAPYPIFEEDEFKFLTKRQQARRPKFVELYERLIAGDLPTLKELHKLLRHDGVAAVAYDVMDQIANEWLPSPDERHKRALKD